VGWITRSFCLRQRGTLLTFYFVVALVERNHEVKEWLFLLCEAYVAALSISNDTRRTTDTTQRTLFEPFPSRHLLQYPQYRRTFCPWQQGAFSLRVGVLRTVFRALCGR
jgi:hypothetical protein